jgi:hypothetical protein
MMHGIVRIGTHLISVTQRKLLYTGQVSLSQQGDDRIINIPVYHLQDVEHFQREKEKGIGKVNNLPIS